MAPLVFASAVLAGAQAPTLFDAARKGDTRTVRRYLDAGGDPNAREPKTTLPSLEKNDPGGKAYLGDGLLGLATQAQDRGLVQLLLDRHADPNRAGEFGDTPLNVATSCGNADLVRILLRRGAKPDLRGAFGDTALVQAAHDGNVEIADMLLRRGASLRGGTGWTPLMQSAYNGQAAMLRFLLQRGADPNAHPKGLMSPLECAVVQGHDGLAGILKRRGAKGDVARLRAQNKRREVESAKKDAASEKSVHSASPTPMTDEDGAVIEAAMRAFQRERESPSDSDEKAGELRLGSKTFELRAQWDEGQMSGEVGEKRARELTLDLRRDLFARNKGRSDLSAFHPGPGIVLVSPEELSKPEERFWRAKPYALASLPGYSPRHERAVVRFAFGPTPHGAAGTVLLERRNGSWQALWCALLYYA